MTLYWGQKGGRFLFGPWYRPRTGFVICIFSDPVCQEQTWLTSVNSLKAKCLKLPGSFLGVYALMVPQNGLRFAGKPQCRPKRFLCCRTPEVRKTTATYPVFLLFSRGCPKGTPWISCTGSTMSVAKLTAIAFGFLKQLLVSTAPGQPPWTILGVPLDACHLFFSIGQVFFLFFSSCSLFPPESSLENHPALWELSVFEAGSITTLWHECQLRLLDRRSRSSWRPRHRWAPREAARSGGFCFCGLSVTVC